MTKLVKVPLNCPHCGHQQLEPPAVITAICKKCGRHFRAQDAGKPGRPARTAPPPSPPRRERRQVRCFDCAADVDVTGPAQSTMCKSCGRYIDLLDYEINSAISKNFKTKGTFVIQPKGYVFNTAVIAGNAIIRGRLLGRITAEETLTLYATAEIKGTFTAGRLVIPADNLIRWKESVQVGSAEIAGELIANLNVERALVIKSTGRVFGNVEAGSVIVEPGGVIVGETRIHPKAMETAVKTLKR